MNKLSIYIKISILQHSYYIFEVSRITYKNIALEELTCIYLEKFSLNF